eukprot:649651_1
MHLSHPTTYKTILLLIPPYKPTIIHPPLSIDTQPTDARPQLIRARTMNPSRVTYKSQPAMSNESTNVLLERAKTVSGAGMSRHDQTQSVRQALNHARHRKTAASRPRGRDQSTLPPYDEPHWRLADNQSEIMASKRCSRDVQFDFPRTTTVPMINHTTEFKPPRHVKNNT